MTQEHGVSVPSVPRRKSLRSQLYRSARALGNLEAAEKGPTALRSPPNTVAHELTTPWLLAQTHSIAWISWKPEPHDRPLRRGRLLLTRPVLADGLRIG